MEGLIDKLAHRFGAARDVRLWRTLAFCMSLLTYSERGVRKLAECFKDYKNALVDEEVLQHLLTVVGKVRFASHHRTWSVPLPLSCLHVCPPTRPFASYDLGFPGAARKQTVSIWCICCVLVLAVEEVCQARHQGSAG